jgi:hypothetical protein
MADDAARVQCRKTPPVLIPLAADRTHIAQLLSRSVGPVLPPSAEDLPTYPDAPSPEQLWCELLDDLGAHLEDLSHADSDLRLVSVHRNGLIAHIQVTNGVRELTHEVPLDSKQTPAAVTIDIARIFPSGPDPTDQDPPLPVAARARPARTEEDSSAPMKPVTALEHQEHPHEPHRRPDHHPDHRPQWPRPT